MTQDAPTMPPRSRIRTYLFVSVLGVVALGVAVALVGLGRDEAARTRSEKDGSGAESEEQVRKNVRDALARAPEADTCRAALDQLNNFLSRQPEPKFSRLSPQEAGELQKRYGLDPGSELPEVESPSFTMLDAHHLDLCLLLRDAARAQGLKAPGTLDQARQAFDWVTREVRLQAGEDEPLPPAFVVRRGWGTAQERALVFLSLLQQLRIPGCMLAYGVDESGQRLIRYWLPGALIGKEIYLFDTRLGRPLPGPKGKGVATLAQLRKADGAEILPQLSADPKHPYDVTAEQVKRVEIHVACPLSALAPRMNYLQTDILGFDLSSDTPQLAADRHLLDQFDAAARGLGVPVRTWPAATRALRTFLPRDQGGTDAPQPPLGMTRQRRFEGELAPWHVLPNQIRNLPGYAGQRLQAVFEQSFRDFYLGPHMPREQLLRGRFDEATRGLVEMMQEIDQHRAAGESLRRAEAAVARWAREFIEANAQLIRAEEASGGARTSQVQEVMNRTEDIWKQGIPALTAVIGSATAETRGAEVTYHIALCKHELAERAWSRSQAGGGHPEEAEDAWKEACYWWEKFGTEYALTPDQFRSRLRQIHDWQRRQMMLPVQLQLAVEYLGRDVSTAVNARRLHARALVCLHETDRAAALLDGLARDLTALEASGDLAELEKADRRGPAYWYLVGAPLRIRQLKQQQ